MPNTSPVAGCKEGCLVGCLVKTKLSTLVVQNAAQQCPTMPSTVLNATVDKPTGARTLNCSQHTTCKEHKGPLEGQCRNHLHRYPPRTMHSP